MIQDCEDPAEMIQDCEEPEGELDHGNPVHQEVDVQEKEWELSPAEHLLLVENMDLLDNLLVISARWLSIVPSHKYTAALRINLENYVESVTQLISMADDENKNWSKADALKFDQDTKLMKTKWKEFKVIIIPFITVRYEKEEEEPAIFQSSLRLWS